ncbi:hypothetical protein [Paenibacillus graminis]|uniref:hypothetical protein n=1 Tax=Paenibacillus graminis TaxID=189425 RepID=UPI0030C97D53
MVKGKSGKMLMRTGVLTLSLAMSGIAGAAGMKTMKKKWHGACELKTGGRDVWL